MSVQNISAGISSSGPSPMQAIGLAANLLGNVNKNDSSTTQSAVSGNINLTVRDGETPTALSRDTENANQSVKVFDKEEYKERAEMAQVIGEISKNAVSIATYEDRQKSTKLKDQAKDAENANDETKAKALYAQAADIDKRIDDTFGIGSTNGQAIAAVTAVLQGLAGDNIGQAVAGGLSPYVNAKIKELTGDNEKANIAAHALWGAIEAQASGNNALAGATAAASGEMAAKLLTQQIYGKEPQDLTASEKETISSLSQVVGALSAVAVANNSNDAYRGAEVAKSAVEHNYLFADEAARRRYLTQQLARTDLSEEQRKEYETEKQAIDAKDIERDEYVENVCSFGNKMSAACRGEYNNIVAANAGYYQYSGETLPYTPYDNVSETYKNILKTDFNKTESYLQGLSVPASSHENAMIDFANHSGLDYNTVQALYGWSGVLGELSASIGGSALLPKGISANEKLPATGQSEGYVTKSVNITYNNAPMGSRFNQMNQPVNPSYQSVRNEITNINGRQYSGHALDRMQDRGITPSVVENAIKHGIVSDSRGDAKVYTDQINRVKVVLNNNGDVITVTYGK